MIKFFLNKEWKGGFVCVECHNSFDVKEKSVKNTEFNILNNFDNYCNSYYEEFVCSM